ncbi:MAG: NAD(P)-binding protein [Euryarchaeota archaeon]|nr:NAD(P)-binding protein [Euryarchaeota archaeon]
MRIGIVGAGPAGLYSAILLSRDFDVQVFEEHSEVGFPEHCTGLVSKYVVDKSGNNVILNRIKGARIFSGNRSIRIEKKDIAAYVIDRKAFEKNLYNNVSESVYLGNRVKRIEIINGVSISTNSGEYKFDIVIGADGPRSLLRNMVTNERVDLLNGVQVILKKNFVEDNYVYIFLDRKYSSGFFAWAVPRESDLLVGLATYDRNPMLRLKALLRDRFNGVEVIGKNAGQIPIGNLNRHYKGSIFLTGDAAVFVKATSGGGLYYGLKGSEILFESIKKNLNYEKILKKMMEELKKDYIIHKIFSVLNDKEILRIISSLDNEETIEIINKYGDIDYPSILAKKLILNKNIIKVYPLLLRSIFRSYLI